MRLQNYQNEPPFFSFYLQFVIWIIPRYTFVISSRREYVIEDTSQQVAPVCGKREPVLEAVHYNICQYIFKAVETRI